MGIEFREGSLVLNAKNQYKLKKGPFPWCLCVGVVLTRPLLVICNCEGIDFTQVCRFVFSRTPVLLLYV
jgi:hypothetical protein